MWPVLRRTNGLRVALAIAAVIGCATAAGAQSDRAASGDAIARLLEAGRYADAQELAERELKEPSRTANDPESARDLVVETLVRNGHGADRTTRELAEDIARNRRAVGASSPQRLATSLRHLGDVLFQSGDYAQAVTRLREALATRERTLDADPVDIAEDLEHLSQALARIIVTEAVAADEALRLIDRALSLRRESGASLGLARALRTRGILWRAKGDYARAHADLDEARMRFQAAYPVHPETALALASVGDQLALEGELRSADEMLSHACAMAEATLRPEHPDIASCLRSRAVVHEELGDLAGAKTLRERGLRIAEASLGTAHPGFAVQLNDLANNYLLQGEYATARRLYERARRAYAQTLGPDNNGATVASYNLALLDARLGDYREARRGFERVTAVWTKGLGPNHLNVAMASSALAELLGGQGLDEEARGLYTRALHIREKVLGPDHRFVARTLSNLALTLSRLGQSRNALAFSNRSLRIWERSGAQDGLAEALVTHAEILSHAGDIVAAQAAYTRALDIRIPLLGPAHPTVAENQIALAAVELRLGEPANAFRRALNGQRVAREHALLTLASLPERQALEYAATRPKGLDLALSLANDPAGRAVALDEIILSRALTLDEMGSRRRAAADAESGDTKRLWDDLRSSRQRFANLVVSGPRNDARHYAALVDEARRDKEAAERALGERSAVFIANERRVVIGLDQVRRALPPGTAMVSFVRYDRSVAAAAPRTASPRTVPSYLAFVLRAGDADPVAIALGNAASIDRAVDAWRHELVAGAGAKGSALRAAERSLRISGARLRGRIWDPIADQIAGAARVFVVPDAALNLVPIAALPAAGGGYLLERGPVVHYLSAERDLAATERPRPGTRGGLLAVGGPAFAERTLFAALRPPGASATRGASPRCASFQNMRFPPLPGTAREVEEVAALWTPRSAGADEGARTLVGGAATETAFKQLAPGQRVLHLATHGFFLSDDCATATVGGTRAIGAISGTAPQPAALPVKAQRAVPENPLLLSGLALAGANRRAAAAPDEDDGILTAEEVAGLDLTGVEWAVLSACDTGLGLIRAGEGVLGLRRAFQTAGARTVIMSLWPVEDRATRQWMAALYRARLERQLDTIDSARDAALATLQARRAGGLSGHPFFWAGFVASGDWR